jgi:hypothetical protein
VITRRNLIIGASAVLITAPAIVRAATLMPVRSMIIRDDRIYYGFCERLAIDHRYRTGALRDPALIRVINDGVLRHIPPDKLAYDLDRWGTVTLSLEAREQRRAILWPGALPISAFSESFGGLSYARRYNPNRSV